MSCVNVNNSNFKAYFIVDSSNNIISSYNGSNDAVFNDVIKIPNGATKIYVNNDNTINTTIICKKYNPNYVDNGILENKNKNAIQDNIIDLTIKRAVRNEILNPFKYKSMGHGIITFTFDDGVEDLDLVASIFEEYDIPLCVAMISSNLTKTCNGLTANKGSYTTGMTIKQVCDTIVSLGGEVLSHNSNVVTALNVNDYDFMYNHFLNSKASLVANGYTVRGIMLSGGTNQLQGGTVEQGGLQMQYWSGLDYEYSDQYGITENYYSIRKGLNNPIATTKSRIDECKINKTWLRFYAHSLDGREAYVTESNLRTILEYCISEGIEMMTWSEYYDTYKPN